MEALLRVGDVIRAAAARTPGNIAVSLCDRHISFAALNQESNALASSLLAQGVRPGDRVGWWAETSIEAVLLYFATAHIGAIFMPLNPRYTDEEEIGRAHV